jgi:ketosteroid isomerase-like protein
MIEKTVENWHKLLRGELEGGLDAILADDVVFYSPIVFSPQKGKAITKLYLEAAFATLAGDPDADSGESRETQESKKFRYAKEVISGNHAFLEFETHAAGKYINGVDIISCNDAGLISEFKVMIRPLQAVNLLHQQMATMLEKMQA